jgi:hypothetical protein
MSNEERKSLVESLRDTVMFFKERKTVGRMKTEHSIFIPSALMVNQAEDTEEFIKVARAINKYAEWNCPVSAEQITMVKIAGIEFVFGFNASTDFDSIIGYIDSKLSQR